jgi:hypothetical protein
LRQVSGGSRAAHKGNNSPGARFFAQPALMAARSAPMNGIIYLIGLIVVIMAILSFFGLR